MSTSIRMCKCNKNSHPGQIIQEYSIKRCTPAEMQADAAHKVCYLLRSTVIVSNCHFPLFRQLRISMSLTSSLVLQLLSTSRPPKIRNKLPHVLLHFDYHLHHTWLLMLLLKD